MTAAIALTMTGACKPVPDDRIIADKAIVEDGRRIAVRAQCGSCHVLPGVDWPQGKLGPALDHYGERGLVAGALPNTPVNLAAFIRNAPAVKPGTAMPAIAIDEAEARAVAHYLVAEGRR